MTYTPYRKASYQIATKKDGKADTVTGYTTQITSTAGATIHVGIDKRGDWWYLSEISTGRSFGTGNGSRTRRQATDSITDHQIDTVAAYLAKHPELAIA